ncbi:pilus assembly protein CpaE [Sulfobacillus thermosulfidooxidans DSM 9293]|uniref:Pilus assembly protein CpaE n=1 Tax=Sulfobacillus thermosulfidooxidans (strain DSM 9293 / VKM B-1269 / AT-1) TaxID=929705 RepID=A0A1W1WG16_SULTA|nr:AAA family ATPase [Sulfobacillus thermosulfidooxidans]SMC05119.1 pilus assembly protein CpaE [Sulfobacillus thermosulfidooxidans DSM 9293]
MVSVLVAAISPVMESIDFMLRQLSFVNIAGSTESIREAVDIASVEPVDAMIVDESLLSDSWGLQDRLAREPFPLILIIHTPSVESTRRALAIHAADVITQEAIPSLLPPLLKSLNKSEEHPMSLHRIIGVYSAKGGVGKTTLAVNLAWSLALLSERPTALVDLDLQFGDIGPMVHDSPDVTIRELVEGSPKEVEEDKLSRSLIAVDGLPLNLLLAPLHPQYADLVESHHVKDILQHLKATHVFTVCDLSAALSDQNLSAMDLVDVLMMVATPEMITLRNVARSLKVLQTLYPEQGRIRVVINRAGTGMTSDQISQVLPIPVSYWMPSGGVTPVRSANTGKPLVVVDPSNPLAISIENIAKTLLEEFEGASRRTVRKDVL